MVMKAVPHGFTQAQDILLDLMNQNPLLIHRIVVNKDKEDEEDKDPNKKGDFDAQTLTQVSDALCNRTKKAHTSLSCQKKRPFQ
jgi:hypothetical protein